MNIPIALLCLALVAPAASAETILLDERFVDNAAGWKLEASGYGKPEARIGGGILLIRPTSGGGETSSASASLSLPLPHTNVTVSFTARLSDGQFWDHRALFDLMDAAGRPLGRVGILSTHNADPGIHVAESSSRFHSLIARNEDLRRGEPQSFTFNLHDLCAQSRFAGVDESAVRSLRITFSDMWMGTIAVSALRVTAGDRKPPAPVGRPKRAGLVEAQVAGVRIGRAQKSLAWGSLRWRGDNVLKNLAGPAGPFRVRVNGATVEAAQFGATGLCKAHGLRARLSVSGLKGAPGRLQLRLALANESGADLQIQPSPLYLPGLQVGKNPWDQGVVFPLYFGFAGSLETFARTGGGSSIYPQPLSMQFAALYNHVEDRGIAFQIRDPECRYKEMALRASESGEVSFEVAMEPMALPAGREWRAPPVVIELTGGNWYPAARRYGDWWRSCLPRREPVRWLARAPQMFHANPGADALALRDSQPVPYADYLPAAYGRYQQPTKATPTPITFDLGPIADEKRGGAPGEAAGADAIRGLGSRMLIYMPGITEYDFLPVSKEKKEWWILQPDGSMLPAWKENATFCPGYSEVIDHRVRQAVERVTARGADGVYVDESCAQHYHACYNPLHRHPTPYDWGRSQRALFKAIREAVDRARPEAGMTTEGVCDVVADTVDAYCWGASASGQGEGVPAMRVAFPERGYFSYLGGGRPGLSPRQAAALLFVNGMGYWFVNATPPDPEWTGTLALWRERLSDFLVAGNLLSDPRVEGPRPGDVVARAYRSGDRVLLAAVNLGDATWKGRLARPRSADWPRLPAAGTEMLTAARLPVAKGSVGLALAPGDVAAILLGHLAQEAGR